MIGARDELKAIADMMSPAECERALDLITRWWSGPRCPCCHEGDIDRLVWRDDDRSAWVACATCGFCWDPNEARSLPR